MMMSTTHLINSQVDASIRDDAQHVRNVALVESSHALLLKNMFGAIQNARVLARFPKG